MDGNLANAGAAEGAHMDVGDRRGESSQTQNHQLILVKDHTSLLAYNPVILTANRHVV